MQRYWAFLSYSHVDAADAEWLHKALESFRVPPELVGRRAERFLVPRKLTPIFRDRSELAASSDLTTEIREAIECSRHLIVLCSPAAAKSRWVNEEIRTFKRLRPDGEVLAAILGGEPHATDPDRECFPPALKEKLDARGRPTGEPAEPIAADLRAVGDGREAGLLKLVAGMLDLRLDELVQRDERRRQRKWTLISVGSAAGMLLTTGLAVTAFDARDEARAQRREAESLVGFMIGDLKDKLEPVGRLDALDAVGARVLSYYEKQDKASLSDEALAQRSRALTLMGDIAQRRGDMDGALRRYREGFVGTAEALRRDPANPQRLFDHAQNVFWIGNIATNRGDYDEAARWFGEYRRLADRMMVLAPTNPKWQLEGVYSASNLGALELRRRDYRAAVARFEGALRPLATLRQQAPGELEYAKLEVETRGYLADALERGGRLQPALAERSRQVGLIQQLRRRNPNDLDLQSRLLIALRSAARELNSSGQRDQALAMSVRSVGLSDSLLRTEPGNSDWLDRSAGTRLDHAALLMKAGRLDEAVRFNEAGCAGSARVAGKDRVVLWAKHARLCLENRARLSLAGGNRGQAMLHAGQLLAQIRTEPTADRVEDRFSLATVEMLVGDIENAMGDRAAARRSWAQALALWPSGVAETPREFARHRDLLDRLGRRAEATVMTARLQAMGWKD
ncbi:TIR domain-containing protein [Sphingomonas sp. BN140010]|uniref:TIR domain-containing protein n=1 Tax=Sphingomonas arvum TaxID=2992113 RepID=A0ABT3JF00_9SPHN|nr:TIR domain-containing protein [Sphingomonas sp. BN140010]MCW3797645.1 TIR domain-containing protein [Sphingomonas sp. BN140010]